MCLTTMPQSLLNSKSVKLSAEVSDLLHFSVLMKQGFKSLEEGEEVEYNLSDKDGRPVATDVTGPNGAQPIGRTGD